MSEQLYFYMMVGLPGSGKSYYVRNHLVHHGPIQWTVASSDAFIETQASLEKSTYNAVFERYVNIAGNFCHQVVLSGVKHDRNIVWDQTNLTMKVRKKKLLPISNRYKKICLVVQCKNPDDLVVRLASRPGKNIPPEVMERMKTSFEMPSTSEGFDRVDVIET